MEGREETEAPDGASPSDGAARRWIVGLGNPGPDYGATRHNVGFRVVEEIARRLDVPLVEGECRARLGGTAEISLVQPLTYMNRSGATLRCLTERHEIGPERFLVIYDEVHLPLGRIRLRPSGSPAGHRGLASILQALESDRIPRLRLGVGPEGGPPPGEELAEFVLSPFGDGERDEVEEMILRAASASLAWANEGIEAAMQAHNG